MVEYALLVGGTAFRTLVAEASALADGINWTYVEWGAAILIMLRIVFWAFSPGPHR
jgi:Flp pilus assembly pilin Flp